VNGPLTSTDVDDGTLGEQDVGSVRWLTISRASVHNALNGSVLEELSAALDRVESTPSVRAVVVTGSGSRAFSAGADLDELEGLDAAAAYQVLESGGRVMRKLDKLPVPVIAAVNGLALGGGFELALACTFMVASTNAQFGFPETGLGLMPGYGGTQRLVRQLGDQAARAMILTGSRIDATTAREIGLLFLPPKPTDEFASFVRELATRIASCGPDATSRALEALRLAGDVPLEAGLKAETLLASVCVGSNEAAVGIRAFRQRRQPEFTSRSM
jgi:enoyl-CoA hydratase